MLSFTFGFISCARQSNDKIKRVGIDRLSDEEKERFATPTMYYIPSFNVEDNDHCGEGQHVDILDKDGYVLIATCRKVYRSCLMQGTCRVAHMVNGKAVRMLINVDRRHDDGSRSFKDISKHICRFGIGDANDRFRSYSNMCLEPYYSVAADLSIYNLGEVIFIPYLKGVTLPNGTLHDGYVVVRDSGQRIKGKGRFDFFTGFHSVNKTNVFHKAGLSGGVHYPEYFVVTGDKADRIRSLRKFPIISVEN